jgi:ATP-dependent protease ClpP protease subunit
LANCANQGVRQVYILLSTPGGNVIHGLNLYNVIRAMPLELTMHNVGNVDSIGNAIFLAGKRRFACPHSTFMFHGVGFEVNAGSRFEEIACRQRLDGILTDQKRIGEIIAENTKATASDIEGFFREAQTKDGQPPLASGLLTRSRTRRFLPAVP